MTEEHIIFRTGWFAPILRETFAVGGKDGLSGEIQNRKYGKEAVLRTAGGREIFPPFGVWTGWTEGGRIVIAGMKPRRRVDHESTFEFSFGKPVIAEIEPDTGSVFEHPLDPKLEADIDRELTAIRNKKFFGIGLEGWLGSFETNGGRMLLGAVIQDNPPFNDNWDMDEAVWPIDYATLSLCERARSGEVRFFRLYDLMTYFGAVRIGDEDCLYLGEVDGRGLLAGRIFVVGSKDGSTSYEPKKVDLIGVPGDMMVSTFRFESQSRAVVEGWINNKGTVFALRAENPTCWVVQGDGA